MRNLALYTAALLTLCLLAYWTTSIQQTSRSVEGGREGGREGVENSFFKTNPSLEWIRATRQLRDSLMW